MKSKILSLLLLPVSMLLPLVLQSCSDDDDTSTIGTSYWNANDLKGRWVSADETEHIGIEYGETYIDFKDNGTFTCELGLGKYRHSGEYATLNSNDPHEIGVRFPGDGDNSWTVWTIKWLTSDKSQMQISTFHLKKQK